MGKRKEGRGERIEGRVGRGWGERIGEGRERNKCTSPSSTIHFTPAGVVATTSPECHPSWE